MGLSPTQHASAAIHLNQSPEGEVAVELQSGPLFSETTYIKAYEALNGIDDQKKRKKWLVRAIAGAVIAGAVTGLFLMFHGYKSRPAVDLASPLFPDACDQRSRIAGELDGRHLKADARAAVGCSMATL